MPSVETARLRLRQFRNDDLDDLATLLADPDVMRYVGNGLPITRDEVEIALHSIVRHWQQHGFGRWAVFDNFAKPYWGRGLATELGKASLRFGFDEHEFDRIVAVAKPENLASVRVMEKIGMNYESHTAYYDIDVIQYQVLRSQYQPDNAPYKLIR